MSLDDFGTLVINVHFLILIKGQFHRAAIIQGVLLYTMNPSKTRENPWGGGIISLG
jgi:hypothetical protein